MRPGIQAFLNRDERNASAKSLTPAGVVGILIITFSFVWIEPT